MTQCLWAPWRMAFIASPKTDGCVLCNLIAPNAAGTDRERLILWRGPHTYCVMNLYPYNCGHLMVIPNHHGASLSQLAAAAHEELMWATGQTIDILQRILEPAGFNCGMNLGHVAGAGMPDHVHMHIVPRWSGDTNFMPILADTRALPEHLDATYQRLHPAFEQLTR